MKKYVLSLVALFVGCGNGLYSGPVNDFQVVLQANYEKACRDTSGRQFGEFRGWLEEMVVYLQTECAAYKILGSAMMDLTPRDRAEFLGVIQQYLKRSKDQLWRCVPSLPSDECAMDVEEHGVFRPGAIKGSEGALRWGNPLDSDDIGCLSPGDQQALDYLRGGYDDMGECPPIEPVEWPSSPHEQE